MDVGEDFERFCAVAYPRLVGALAHHCGDLHLAEEFAQEALVRAGDRWDHVRHLDAPVGWAYRVGANLATSWFRRRRVEERVRRRLADTTGHREPDTAAHVAVRQALAELTDKQRQAVLLRFYLGLSAEEAAEVMGGRPGAVRALTHRALASLRGALGAEVVVPEEVPDER